MALHYIWMYDDLLSDLSIETKLLDSLATKVMSRMSVEEEPTLLTTRHMLRYLLEGKDLTATSMTCLLKLQQLALQLPDYWCAVLATPALLCPPPLLLAEVLTAVIVQNYEQRLKAAVPDLTAAIQTIVDTVARAQTQSLAFFDTRKMELLRVADDANNQDPQVLLQRLRDKYNKETTLQQVQTYARTVFGILPPTFLQVLEQKVIRHLPQWLINTYRGFVPASASQELRDAPEAPQPLVASLAVPASGQPLPSPAQSGTKPKRKRPRKPLTTQQVKVPKPEPEPPAETGVEAAAAAAATSSSIDLSVFDPKVLDPSVRVAEEASRTATVVIDISQAAGEPASDGGENQGSRTPRRKIGRWTEQETTELIELVREFGRGAWRKVLDADAVRKQLLVTRTQVDVKDKWRNLEKSGRLPSDMLFPTDHRLSHLSMHSLPQSMALLPFLGQHLNMVKFELASPLAHIPATMVPVQSIPPLPLSSLGVTLASQGYLGMIPTPSSLAPTLDKLGLQITTQSEPPMKGSTVSASQLAYHMVQTASMAGVDINLVPSTTNSAQEMHVNLPLPSNQPMEASASASVGTSQAIEGTVESEIVAVEPFVDRLTQELSSTSLANPQVAIELPSSLKSITGNNEPDHSKSNVPLLSIEDQGNSMQTLESSKPESPVVEGIQDVPQLVLDTMSQSISEPIPNVMSSSVLQTDVLEPSTQPSSHGDAARLEDIVVASQGAVSVLDLHSEQPAPIDSVLQLPQEHAPTETHLRSIVDTSDTNT